MVLFVFVRQGKVVHGNVICCGPCYKNIQEKKKTESPPQHF